jgi:tRNA(fMet)-specific endonuclease VapC
MTPQRRTCQFAQTKPPNFEIPVMLKYMLDTDTVIYTVKNRPQRVRKVFEQHSSQMGISTVTSRELIYGAEKSSQAERNLADIAEMAARLEVLPFDTAAAAHFGQIRAELAKTGRPIGPYDQMIAGHARSLGLILVTNNVREFKRIPGLRIKNWIA